ncbi:hypothetical protein F5Y13DRAFT_150038 [Hypoxylon sp. FL1857]|nr:hypothetical protein F5Y13DRAFT_150038 [Hypoxylon sp. FL1857]
MTSTLSQTLVRSVASKIPISLPVAMDYLTSSDSKQKAPRPSAREGGSLYFAYGSNLHLTQMANRCPASVFKGKAVLHGYRWQINERGVANVVESAQDSVEGLLYLVTPKDERALDRSEGVSKNLYQKHLLKVDFEPHEKYSDLKSFRVAQLIAQLTASHDTDHPESYSSSTVLHAPAAGNLVDNDTHAQDDAHNGGKKQKVKALVYVSENYANDGSIRNEYIQRMKNAAIDAMALGISRSFVEKYIAPVCFGKNEMPVVNEPAASGGRPPPNLTGYEASNTIPPESKMQYTQTSRKMATLSKESQPFHGLDYGSSNFVDLHELKRANRSPHPDSGLEFPKEMLDAITSTRSQTVHHGQGTSYIVVVEENSGDTNPRFRIAATTTNLELANELAIKDFRTACVQLFPNITMKGSEYWVKVNSVGTQPGFIGWKLEENVYIQLGINVPETHQLITVRVEPHELLTSIP